MTYLLDVNVLIALMDQDHVFNERAHQWFGDEGSFSWATCPITENGVMRILSHARYRGSPGTPSAVAEMLLILRQHPGHVFWTDETSLLDDPAVNVGAITTAARVTDTYLLASARRRGGKLATFDRRLSSAAVKGGSDALHLIQ